MAHSGSKRTTQHEPQRNGEHEQEEATLRSMVGALAWSDSLSLIPFVAIATLLYFIAVKNKNGAEAAPKRA